MTSSGRTVLVASLLLLAACSSHASSPTATSRPTTTTTTTTTATSTTTSTASSTTTTAAPTNTATTARPATTVATPRQAPAGDAFYTPPSPLPTGRPGDLIWARPLADDGTRNAWQILYLSQTVDGAPVAVSGLVVTPKTAATGPRDVLAWAHGTTGLGDTCAISRQYVDGSGSETLLTSLAAPLGLAFVATDYQGLGTPGGHTFLVGQAEGRDVLDAVRAAAQIPASGVTAASRTIIWGHSQGGGAAAFAAELAPTYAPELKVIGAMAGAPAGDLTAIAASLNGGEEFGYTLMALDGFRAAYPNLPFADVLTPKGVTELATIEDECSDAILAQLQGGAASDYIKADLSTVPAFAAALKANTAGYVKTSVPIFLYHGDADETVPVAVSKLMLDRYCALGVTVERKVYPGGTHVGVLLQAAGDLQRWITDRLAGTPVTSSC